MGFRQLKDTVLAEVSGALEGVRADEVDEFARAVLDAGKVFVMGGGRSMLVAQAFAKRLGHAGLKVSVVGATTEPPMAPGDLLVACSASGETRQTVMVARIAGELGGKVAVITASPQSALAKLAGLLVYIPTPAGLDPSGGLQSVQPAGNLFEQSLFILLDSVAMLVQEARGLSNDDLCGAHANLE